MGIYEKYELIAKEYGTPYYLFEIGELYKRIKSIKDILEGKAKLCFAMKANPFLIPYINDMVDKYEVCSHGEYEICKKAGIDSKQIVLSGVYKESGDIRETFEDKFEGTYTLESKKQCSCLYEMAREKNKKVHVLIRLTSGNQFGMNKEDIEELLNNADYNKYFIIDGIHYFSGTQKKNHVVIENEIKELADFYNYIECKYNKHIPKLEYGPGLYIDYYENQIENFDELQFLKNALSQIPNEIEITIELGRYVAAFCGKYVTKVVDVKNNLDVNYVITDGGIHHLSYYGQMLGIKVPRVSVLHQSNQTGEKKEWVVCGALCTIHDILLKRFETESLQEGDLFVFHDVGAYSMTDTNVLFLSRELPMILVENEDATIECLRKRLKSTQFNMKSENK